MNLIANKSARSTRVLVALLSTLAAGFSIMRAQVSLTGTGGYTQNFSEAENPGVSIATAANNNWANGTTIANWHAFVNGVAPTLARSTTGEGQDGYRNSTYALYLFRSGGSDGALGTIRYTNKGGSDTTASNTGFTAIGVSFTNNTGKTITALDISYLLQQWQANPGTGDGFDFQYSLDATSLADTAATWVDHNALDGNALQVGTNNFAYVGNDKITTPDYSKIISSSITGLAIANGQTFWLRWVDRDIGGIEQALSIDNFVLTATLETPSIPEPSTCVVLVAIAGLVFAFWRRLA
ncbi:PEP-CTERM domain protein [Geminisphaera colitermitum]|uniref:PEP-CTERM domain protein n=1 Tax=Geminisphaera colitermitum TaxID=1148786 RepID=UPI000158D07B|nr:PEP-CTERM domain protein [Geminisphaera colitermitum]